jgi:adenosylmethionine-8-amino-7-oxononanoate aminotransferase
LLLVLYEAWSSDETLKKEQAMVGTVESRASARRHVWMGSIRGDQVAYHGPLVFTHGKGVYLYDINGKRYLDAMSGAWVVNIGHGRTRMAQALALQAEQVAFVLHEGYTTLTTIALAERLATLTPSGLDRIYFSCGGSEAVETALKVAKQYHVLRQGRPRHKIVARTLSYHGATYGAMSVTGFDDWRWIFAPPVPGAKFAPHPHCYRCPLDLTYPSCNVACVDDIEQIILREKPETVGAVIAEPISAASAVSIPPPEYWSSTTVVTKREVW